MTTTVSTGGRLGGAARFTLVVSCSSLFLGSLDSTAVTVALPDLQADLGLDVATLQWVVTIAALARGALLFPAGVLADRFGPRRMFALGTAIFAGASAVCAASPSVGLLLAARAVQGAGGALMTPSSIALLVVTFTEPRARAQALGFWSASAGVATAIGPLVGGALVTVAGWRAVFVLCLPFATLILLGIRRVPRDRPADSDADRFDITGLALLGAAMILATSALSAVARHGWATVQVLGGLAGAAVAVAGFAMVERRVRVPVLRPGTFADRRIRGAVLAAGLAYLCLAGMAFVNSLYLQQVRGLSPLQAGLMSLPLTVTTTAAAVLAGRWMGTAGPRPPVLAGLGLLAGSLILLAALTTPAGPLWPLLVGYLLMGLGMGLTNPPATASAVAGLGGERSGTASAITSISRQLGTNVGVALAGGIATSVAGSLAGAAIGSAGSAPEEFTAGVRVAYAATAALVSLGWIVAGRLFPASAGPDPPPPPAPASRPTTESQQPTIASERTTA